MPAAVATDSTANSTRRPVMIGVGPGDFGNLGRGAF